MICSMMRLPLPCPQIVSKQGSRMRNNKSVASSGFSFFVKETTLEFGSRCFFFLLESHEKLITFSQVLKCT